MYNAFVKWGVCNQGHTEKDLQFKHILCRKMQFYTEKKCNCVKISRVLKLKTMFITLTKQKRLAE